MLLRKLNEDDEADLAHLSSSPAVASTLPDSFYSLPDNPYWLINSDRLYDFAIEDDGKLVGCIGLWPGKDEQRPRAELGYWLGEDHWNKGICTKAVKALVGWAFSSLPSIYCIWASPYSSNPASCRVLEKSGFTLVGTLHSSVIKDGVVLDAVIYERTR